MYYHYFDPEMTDLCEEIGEHHPEVLAVLASLTDKDIYMQIAAISAHCGMILDGAYSKEDILGICKTLTEKLRDSRTIHVISPLQ